MTATAPGAGRRAVFLGDSYTSGWALAAADLPLRWTSRVADALDWFEINAGFPGAGYVASGPVSRAPYRQILPRLADAAPDVVIISGGLNDLYADDARIAKAVRSTVRALATAFPAAARFAVSAVAPRPGETLDRLAALNAVLSEASAASNAAYLAIGQPLLGTSPPDRAFGLGAVAGTSARAVGPDLVHPTAAGHAAIAANVLDALAASGLLGTPPNLRG